VSYSLYLVHVPVALALAHALHGTLPAAAIAALTVVLALPAAAVFYAAVERPSLLLSRLRWMSGPAQHGGALCPSLEPDLRSGNSPERS
jgi:peptidoglycan/LPS O-acetylase OafA/YrhL